MPRAIPSCSSARRALDYVGSAVNIDTLERRDGTWKVVRHDSCLDPATALSMQAIMDEQEN